MSRNSRARRGTCWARARQRASGPLTARAFGCERDYDARVRIAVTLTAATLALGCGGPTTPAAVNVPVLASPAAPRAPEAGKALPACAPRWLDVAPVGPGTTWGRVDVEGADVSRWEGLWIEGEPKSCAFFVAVRREGNDVVVYANNCGGPGLWISNASITGDRLVFSGKWTASTAGADVMLVIEAPDRASGAMSSFGPMANPDDEGSRPEPVEKPIALTRRCK